MKIAQNGAVFTLAPECDQDHTFIAALDLERHVSIHGFHWNNTVVTLEVSATGKAALEAKAARECLSAFGKLVSLGLTEAARHGHVITNTANPQPQE